MSRKNHVLIKWMLGILIVLMAVVYGMYQTSTNMALPKESHISSSSNFLQFLKHLIGRDRGSSSETPFNWSSIFNPNNWGFGQTKNMNMENQQHSNTAAINASSLKSTAAQRANNASNKSGSGGGSTSGGGSNGSSSGNNSGNGAGNGSVNNSGNGLGSNSGNGSGDNSGTGSGDNSGSGSGNNSGTGSGDNSGSGSGNNSGTGSGDNSGTGSGDNSGTGSGDNSGSGSGDNSGTGSGDNSGGGPGNNPGSGSGNNSGNGSGGGPGSYSECIPGCYPGCIPGCDAQCTPPDCLLAGVNPSNLSTQNPIPTDPQVTQNISLQNQQAQALATELASRQALVAPVIQQAQASKYQTVTSPGIPIPSTNPAPSDIETKVQSKQYSFH